MRIQKDSSIVLIIDIQEKLFPHIYENQQFLANTKKLIEGLKILEIPIIVTEQYSKGLGQTIPGIASYFEPFNPFEKISFSCMDDPHIKETIIQKDKKFVILFGIEAHVCVLQTAIDLFNSNFIPIVISDCISSRKISDKQIALLRMQTENIVVSTYESVLFELLRFAGNDHFRAISRLIK